MHGWFKFSRKYQATNMSSHVLALARLEVYLDSRCEGREIVDMRADTLFWFKYFLANLKFFL